MHEESLIRTMLAQFDRCPTQRNAPFAADAELIEIGGRLWGISMDEFGAEDQFGPATPECIGWNVAVATVSDLLAAAVQPRFFLQAVTLPDAAPEAFAAELSRGVAAALRACDCFLLGGDLGCGDSWRYVGVALGEARLGLPLTRCLPQVGRYDLWATGTFGDANAAALTGSAVPRFELRTPQAAAFRELAAAAIDSSDGFFPALWQLHRCNPEVRWEIDATETLLDADSARLAVSLGINPLALLMGGAGEYELLFALPEGTPFDVVDARRIGRAVPGQGVHVKQARGMRALTVAPPNPREFASRESYIAAVCQAAEALG